MSVFSEQNARLRQGLVDAKTAIEAKKGSVVVANETPQIEEIVAGISTVKAGEAGEAGVASNLFISDFGVMDEALHQYLNADGPTGTVDYDEPLCVNFDQINFTDIPVLTLVDSIGIS